MSKKSRDDLKTTVEQPFERVESDEVGYEPSHVDAFMTRARKAYEGSGELTVEDVRQARFATVNGGYATDQVDDALDRLEDALADSERAAFVSERGDEDWTAMLAERTEELLGRADRAPGERFRRPSRTDAQSYDVDQVDEFCDRLAGALRAPAGEAELDADDVRRAAFASAEGRKGYEEGQVDAYLDAAVDVLLRRG
jgi:DivIVA domain-containing protein